MHQMPLRCLYFCVVLALVGCDDRAAQQPSKKPGRKVAKKTVAAKASSRPKKTFESTSPDDNPNLRQNRSVRRTFREDEPLQPRDSTFAPPVVQQTSNFITTAIRESVNYGPTLVVWVVDRTDSAQQLRSEMLPAIRALYAEGALQAKTETGEARLLSAVVTFGKSTDEIPEPTGDAGALLQAFDKLARDDSGREATFATLLAAGEKYLPFRTQQRREVLFVLITDEVGDDLAQEETAIALFKKHVIPVYVVGLPAPFGRPHVGDLNAESRGDGTPGVVFGPESRQVEVVALESLGGNYDLEVMESGFGPFSLERLARATEGKFVALLRPTYREGAFFGLPGTEWPTPRARQFDPQIMKRYAPDYVSAAEYEAFLASNAAAAALVAAGKLPRAEVRAQLTTTFAKRNEAQFKTDLDKAQQPVARLEQAVEKLYDTLAAGEGDRAKLQTPRWQAGYDLAMGRACAAKARLDGYNTMVAALKNGKPFERETSTRWRLEPAETTEGTSSIAKLVERSRMYLTRVTTDHPGTPWATIAERELAEQVGWKWVEE